MSRFEYLERLPAPFGEERWLVRAGEEHRIAWVLEDVDEAWREQIVDGMRPWLGWAHPRVSRLFSIEYVGARVMLEHDDDRGPSFAAAAAELEGEERERWAIAQVITLADALAAMARQRDGFVHRRLEPHRMFVDQTGHARLRTPVETVSVGAERMRMGVGTIKGTVAWLSPEQVRGQPLTAASDVYSLASNLALALTGERPFRADTELGTLELIFQGPTPVVATHAVGLDRVLARAFAIDPAKRYPDPLAFATELYACVPDAGDFDAVSSDRIAAWWPTAPPTLGENHLVAGPACRRTWESLEPIRDDIRHCGDCMKPVVRARSPLAILPLAGQCLRLGE